MKTIGLLGGMSWESTTGYYHTLNTVVKETLGGLYSARIIMYSVDFAELADCLGKNDWNRIEDLLSDAAVKLAKAGADFLVIATNTMHQVAGAVQKAAGVPLIHIAEASADALLARGLKKVGLLGTKPTMEMDFYRQKLEAKNIGVVTPAEDDREAMNRIIFEELCRGIISEKSRADGLAIMERLRNNGAEGMLLACTELGLLFRPQDTDLPLFDTAVIHAEAAAREALR